MILFRHILIESISYRWVLASLICYLSQKWSYALGQ